MTTYSDPTLTVPPVEFTIDYEALATAIAKAHFDEQSARSAS